MDIEVAWQSMAEAVANNEWGKAAEHADDICHWLARGGFPPKVTGIREFDTIVAKATCESIAAWDCVS